VFAGNVRQFFRNIVRHDHTRTLNRNHLSDPVGRKS